MPCASAWPDVRPIVLGFRSRRLLPFPSLPRFWWFRSQAAAIAEGTRGFNVSSILPENIYRVRVRHGRCTKGSKTAFRQILRSFLPDRPASGSYLCKNEYRFYCARAPLLEARYLRNNSAIVIFSLVKREREGGRTEKRERQAC